MNRRKIAIQCIVCDVFENGKLTKIGIEAYIAGRMSRATLDEAMRIGQNLHDRAKAKGITEPKASETNMFEL